MELKRSAGILLHPISLPAPYGIGDFGGAAYEFVDWLKLAGQSWWQILPLGPPDDYNMPYGARSSWAGNPLLISLDALVKAGDLQASDLVELKDPTSDRINYRRVKSSRRKLLAKAAESFFAKKSRS